MTEFDERVSDRESDEAAAGYPGRDLNSQAADACHADAGPVEMKNSTLEQMLPEHQAAPAGSGLETAHSPGGDPGVIMYRAAGFWIRLCAFIIDLIVIAGLNAIIWDLFLPAGAIPGFIHELIHVNALFLGITGALYFILMTRYFQQTLGKMIAGIKVIQRNGEPLSWITVIFRELVARSLSQIMGLNLGYVVCWFNAEKRCVHDLLSDTWVVYEKTQSEPGYIAVNSSRL